MTMDGGSLVDYDQERRATAAACAVLDYHGVVAGFGHVSVRLGGDMFLLSPRVGPGAALAEDFVVITLAGEVISGGPVPIEWHIHAAAYAARPDVQAIMRIHSFAANVLSVIGDPIRPAHYLGSVLGGHVRVHEVPDLITDAARGAEMAAELGGAAALLLRGNGQVVVGASVAEACVRALYLDEAAALQLSAASTGQALRAYTPAETSRFALTWRDEVNINRVWNYHLSRALRGTGAPVTSD